MPERWQAGPEVARGVWPTGCQLKRPLPGRDIGQPNGLANNAPASCRNCLRQYPFKRVIPDAGGSALARAMGRSSAAPEA